MPDPQLISWFRSGGQARMAALADAEALVAQATSDAVERPAPERAGPILDASRALRQAAEDALAWIEEKPSPNAGVNVAIRRAWDSYLEAAIVMASMCEGEAPMTPESGEVARAAIERAQKENWEATMAFTKAVGP